MLVEQWKRDSGTVKKLWSTSGTMRVEQWNRGTIVVEQWNRDGRTVERWWWNSDSGTVVVEQ